MLRKITIFRFLGIALLGAIFYFGIWPFIVGGSRMELFCNSLAPGVSVSELSTLSSEKGYRLSAVPKDQRAFVHESRSMGRFLCEVEFREDRLVSAKYVFND